MRAKNQNLHGNVPDSSAVALLLIDVINDLDFQGNRQLLQCIDEVGTRIAALKKKARKLGIPAIYVNDNFGKWKSNFKTQVAHCLADEVPGRSLVEKLQPDEADYFVLKPKHSGFFSTTLDTLLRYLGARTLVLTGVAGDRCVLFTANDAYLRDYQLFVPADCVASNTPQQNRDALKLMQRILKADVRVSTKLDLARMKKAAE